MFKIHRFYSTEVGAYGTHANTAIVKYLEFDQPWKIYEQIFYPPVLSYNTVAGNSNSDANWVLVYSSDFLVKVLL